MILRNIKLVFITNVLFLMCSVITSLISAWALGAEGRGHLALVTMWTFLCVMIAGLGLPFAHRFWAARKPEWSSEILTLTIVFSLVVGGIAVLISEIVIPHYIGERSPEVIWLLRLFLLNIPVVMMSEMLRGMLEGSRLFTWSGAARMSFILTQALGYLIFWLNGWLTLHSAVLIIIVSQLICLILMLAAVFIKLRPRWSWKPAVLKEELDYGLRSYPGIVTDYTVLRLDQMLLAGMAASGIIGMYTVAVALSEITATLASSVADALMPEVAALGSAEKSTYILGKSLRLTVYAHLLVLIPLWFGAPYILKWIYGAEFVDAAAPLRILLIASIVWSAGFIVINGLNGLGYPGLSTIARLASAVTTVVMLLWLLPTWGMMGAAMASLIGYSVMLTVAFFSLWYKRGTNLWQSIRPNRQDISLAKLRRVLGIEIPETRKVEF